MKNIWLYKEKKKTATDRTYKNRIQTKTDSAIKLSTHQNIQQKLQYSLNLQRETEYFYLLIWWFHVHDNHQQKSTQSEERNTDTLLPSLPCSLPPSLFLSHQQIM